MLSPPTQRRCVIRLGVVRESQERERRVGIAPPSVARLTEKLGFEVIVERGAGVASGYSDDDYEAAGATLVDACTASSYREKEEAEAWEADVLVKVNPPTLEEAERLAPGASLVSLIYPTQAEELLTLLGEKGVTVFALDKVPRITRAQSMDVLSSMGNLAGYRAVVEAAQAYEGYFAPQVTAAGTLPPARVLVIGAGVAGLAAIAAARGLGAEVRAFDTRLATREQVESLGGTFLELQFEESGEGGGGYAKTMSAEFIEAEMELFRQQAKEVSVIITTALIPGRKAPILVPTDVVDNLKPGSIVVDLAASQGGNCELCEPDEVVEYNGVKIIGYTDLTSRMAHAASFLFSANVVHFLGEIGGAEAWDVDLDNEVIRGSCVVHDGAILPPPERKPPPAKKPEPAVQSERPGRAEREKPKTPDRTAATALGSLALIAALFLIGTYAPGEFLQHLTVFVLACFVGWQVVWSVAPALHTPLMSVTNAISGIIIVGGMLQVGTGRLEAGEADLASLLGAVAIFVAAINISGGFLVTQRMLRMFQRKGS